MYVIGTLDTGVTVDKVKIRAPKEFIKRRDEIFFRITRSQLYELYEEYEASLNLNSPLANNDGNYNYNVNNSNNEFKSESIYNLSKLNINTNYNYNTVNSPTSQIKSPSNQYDSSQIKGVFTNYDQKESVPSPSNYNHQNNITMTSSRRSISSRDQFSYVDSLKIDTTAKPYILYDVREESQFDKSHLTNSINYPSQYLRRDYTHPLLLPYRNKEETLIIVYCDDEHEKFSSEVATTLIMRGWNNIYVLTGGIATFKERYPQYVYLNPAMVHSPSSASTAASTPSSSRRLSAAGRQSITPSLSSIPEDRSDSAAAKLIGGSGMGKYGRHVTGGSGSAKESAVTSARLKEHQMKFTANDHNKYNDYRSTGPSHIGGAYDRDGVSESAQSSVSVAQSIISRASARKGRF